jgi:Papain family cysteine protease
MDDGFDHFQKSHGPVYQKDYQYTAKNGSCKESSLKELFRITGHVDVEENDQDDLTKAILSGPVSVAIQANRPVF